MTNDLQQFASSRWLSPLAVVISLSFAGATQTTGRGDVPSVAIQAATGQTTSWNKLPSLVKGPGKQPNLSSELLFDLPPEACEPTRTELTPQPASVVAQAPVLRGLYTGAAKTFALSNGKSRIVWLEVTAYCPCPKCCGPDAAGITASGKPVNYNGGAFVAADPELFPFGAKLRVPGYHQGQIVEVIDRGGAIKGAKVDVYFPTHEQAEAWGRQWVAVTVEKD